MENQSTLIIGANSHIAKAIALETIKENKNKLIVVSRASDFYRANEFAGCELHIVDDYEDVTIHSTVGKIFSDLTYPITQIYICHGLLHDNEVKPEKRLQEFNEESFAKVMAVNATTPILWIKYLQPYLSSHNKYVAKDTSAKVNCKIIVFSARVGSINDNNLGGWYSYRTSKAALNMLLKSAAVEFSRTAKNIKLISFHPGTTDTPLSKPFQKNVPENKLFTSQFVAKQLMKIVTETELDGKMSFIDWQGKNIPW